MTTKIIVTFIATVVFMLSIGCGSSASDSESTRDVAPSDPASTAMAVLKAYQSRDLAKLATLSTSGNKEFFEEIAEQGNAHPRYNSIFQGWRWQSVEAWDGSIKETRFSNGQAIVHFGDMGDDEIAVVVLQKEGARWCFEDVNSPSRDHFNELPTS